MSCWCSTRMGAEPDTGFVVVVHQPTGNHATEKGRHRIHLVPGVMELFI